MIPCFSSIFCKSVSTGRSKMTVVFPLRAYGVPVPEDLKKHKTHQSQQVVERVLEEYRRSFWAAIKPE